MKWVIVESWYVYLQEECMNRIIWLIVIEIIEQGYDPNKKGVAVNEYLTEIVKEPRMSVSWKGKVLLQQSNWTIGGLVEIGDTESNRSSLSQVFLWNTPGGYCWSNMQVILSVHEYLKFKLQRCTHRSSHPEVFSSKGFLKICNKFTGERQCGNAISIKLQSKFIEITFWHRCYHIPMMKLFAIAPLLMFGRFLNTSLNSENIITKINSKNPANDASDKNESDKFIIYIGKIEIFTNIMK